MAEFEEKLNAILGDPETMGQIVSIAKALTGEGDSAESRADPPSGPTASAPPAGGGTGDLLSLLGNLDPRLIQGAISLLTEFHTGEDDKTALLNALRPFLKEERRAKMDQAVRIAKTARLLRGAFRLLQENGEGDHHV